MWRRCRTGVAIGAALLLGAIPPLHASAQAPPEQVTVFVIDLSGSMKEPFASGGTKLDAAKAAFTTAFQGAVKRGGKIAIRTYGDQFPSRPPAQRQENCTRDSRLAVPPSDLSASAEQILSQVATWEGQGDTPVGLALSQAASDIPPGAIATVVLFSDGRDECFDADLDGNPAVGPSWGPNPCDVAAQLRQAGVDLRTGVSRIETIGFLPDASAETELKCIAEKGGGSYTPIQTPEDIPNLEQLLVELAAPRKAVRLGGTPIGGTATADGAPTLPDIAAGQSVGLFTDRIGVNEERWYRTPTYGPAEANMTATVFDLPAQEGITFSIRSAPAPDVNASPIERKRDNAGVPRAPSVSVRCPGCSYSTDSIDLYWVVSLTSTAPLTGAFDLELQVEGPAMGGPPIGCQEPAECYYTGELARLDAELADIEQQIDDAEQSLAPAELVAERNQLREEVADLEAQLADPNRATTSTNWLALLPAVLVALAGIGLGGYFLLRSRRPAVASAEGPDEPPPYTGPPVVPTSGLDSGTAEQGPTERPTEAFGAPGPHAVEIPSERRSEEGLVVERPYEAPSASEERVVETPAQPDPERTLVVTETPAGWYTDPAGQAALRWWDGSAWTEHTS